MSHDAELAAGEAAEQRGDFAEASAAYRRAAASADVAVRAEACFRLGRVAWRQDRLDEALRHYDEARAFARRSGRDEIGARIENGVGALHYARGAYAQARAAYRVALDLSQADGLRAKVALNLGVIANIEGDLDGARRYYEESAAAFARAGDLAGQAMALHNTGMLYADRGHWDEAEEAYARCLDLAERLGNRQLIADVLLNRSEVLCGRGQFDAAVAVCDQAIVLHAESGHELGRAEALRWQGAAYRRLGRLTRAERCLAEALRIAARLHGALLEAEVSWELGLVKADGDQEGAAAEWLTRALAHFTALGARREASAVEAALARLGVRAGGGPAGAAGA